MIVDCRLMILDLWKSLRSIFLYNWHNSLNIQYSIENIQWIVNGFKLIKTIITTKCTTKVLNSRPLSCKRVGSLFLTDSGFRAMPCKNLHIIPKHKKFVPYIGYQGFIISTRKVGSSD